MTEQENFSSKNVNFLFSSYLCRKSENKIVFFSASFFAV